MVRAVSAPANPRGSVSSGPRRASKYKTKLKPTAAPRARRLSRATGKRSFRQFSAKNPFRAPVNGAYKIDHSPFQLSMKAVKLSQLQQPFGMDGHRRLNQCKVVWYWQFSRDWNNPSTTNTAQIPSEVSQLALEQTAHEKTKQASGWFWRWQDKRHKIRIAFRNKLPLGLFEDLTAYFGPSRSLHTLGNQ